MCGWVHVFIHLYCWLSLHYYPHIIDIQLVNECVKWQINSKFCDLLALAVMWYGCWKAVIKEQWQESSGGWRNDEASEWDAVVVVSALSLLIQCQERRLAHKNPCHFIQRFLLVQVDFVLQSVTEIYQLRHWNVHAVSLRTILLVDLG